MSSTKASNKEIQTAETAVRTYIEWINDELEPDAKAVAVAQKALDAATDPIAQMKAHVDLVSAQELDGPGITQDFVDSAMLVAETNGFDGRAFAEVHGVKRQILKQAGFVFGASGSGATRVTRSDIVAVIPASKFTVADLAEISGASVATVAKLVKDLVSENALKNLGVDSERGGRGKPPTLYEAA